MSSMVSILANIYLICLLLVYTLAPGMLGYEVANGPDELCVWGVAKGTVTMFSLLTYTIIIQMVIPPMYQELQGRTPEKFATCLRVAFVALFFIFMGVMICGYAVFG